jgi:hypothetical protein
MAAQMVRVQWTIWAERRAEGNRCFQHRNQWWGGDMADMVVVKAFLSW